jgi:hypothetical protein
MPGEENIGALIALRKTISGTNLRRKNAYGIVVLR